MKYILIKCQRNVKWMFCFCCHGFFTCYNISCNTNVCCFIWCECFILPGMVMFWMSLYILTSYFKLHYHGYEYLKQKPTPDRDQFKGQMQNKGLISIPRQQITILEGIFSREWTP